MQEPNPHRLRTGEVDEAPVYAAVERAMGVMPLSLVPYQTKTPRFVWRAELPGGRSVFIKAEHDARDRAALLLEAWAIERARELGVPAPAPLALDASHEIFPGPLLVQEAMRGTAICPVWRTPQDDEVMLSDAQARAAWRSVGEVLRAVHEIRLDGFGRLDDALYARTGEVQGRHRSWADAVLQPALAAITLMRDHRSVDGAELDAARRALDAHADVYASCSDARLLHGDLSARHVFVEPATGELTGIIDWGDREAGDPAHDLANIALWEDDARLEWAIEGYGRDTQDLRRRMRAHMIADGLRMAGKRYAQGRVDAADATMRWLLPRVWQAIG